MFAEIKALTQKTQEKEAGSGWEMMGEKWREDTGMRTEARGKGPENVVAGEGGSCH